MNKFEHASASQIRLFRRCNRKWYFNKIEGIPIPSTKAADLGKKLHEELENYLKFGIALKNPLTRAGLKFLPDPNAEGDLYVEEKVEVKTEEMPVPIIGFADLIELRHGEVEITDHKTTSNFRYCKSPEELRTDPQAIIYGAFCLEQFDPPSGRVNFRHIYYNTKKPDSRATAIVLTDEEITKGLQALAQTMQDMEQASARATSEVTANPQACSDFGGCPFKSKCAKVGNGPGGIFEALIKNAQKKEGESMGRFKNLLERSKQTQTTENDQKTEETKEQETPKETVETEQKLEGINPPDGVPADEIVVKEDTPKAKRGGPFFSDGTRAKSLKKDELFSKFSDDTKGAVFEAHPEIQTFKTRKQILEFMEANPSIFSGEDAPPAAPAKQKDAPEPKPEGEKGTATDVLEIGEEESPPEPREQRPHSTLYIGCHPRKKAITYFEELVRPLQKIVAEDAEAFYYNAIPYAEGPKRVAALLFQKLKTGEMQMPQHLILDRRMPGADACLEVLIHAADEVVERIG